MIMDLYALVRDLIEEAKKQKNLELVEKLIDVKKAISGIEDENKELKTQLEIQQKIVRHSDGTYITLENDSNEIKYCSTCWGRDKKLIQIDESRELAEYLPKCPVCLTEFLNARNGKK